MSAVVVCLLLAAAVVAVGAAVLVTRTVRRDRRVNAGYEAAWEAEVTEDARRETVAAER